MVYVALLTWPHQPQIDIMNQEITYTHLFTKDLKDAFNKKKGTGNKVYAVMEFNTELELGISAKPYSWVNSKAFVTVNGGEALALYVNSTNPMTALITARSFKELNNKMIQMTNNYKTKEFVDNQVDTRFCL